MPSSIHEVEITEAIEYCYRQGWTDGLPVIPPTEERVRLSMESAGRDPQEIVAVVPERARKVTVEKIAINAVMAGCLPKYLPVVIAAVEAITAPEYDFHSAVASTSGGAPLLIVNGPIVDEIGMNSGASLFGPGNRANATIGRAVRLILQNCLGAEVGRLDMACLGHPGKYSYCIAEDEAGSPWEPLHVERGYPREASTVTALHLEGPHHVYNAVGTAAKEVLATFADVMRACNPHGGQFVVVINPEHRAVIAGSGWAKDDIRQFLFEQTHRTLGELRQAKRIGHIRVEGSDSRSMRVVQHPRDVLIVSAGGPGMFSAIIPPWAGGFFSKPITRLIGPPGAHDNWESGDGHA